MKSPDVDSTPRDPPAAPTAAKARIVDAALKLFAQHGVGGTSLQMIANEIGVTKAAVYHQYSTKEAIVLAAAEAELDRLRAIVHAAEAQSSPEARLDALVNGIVDLAVDRRRMTSSILNDPVIVGFFADHEGFRDVMHRFRRLLMGDKTGAEARVQTAMLIAALSGAVMHPFVAGLDDEVIRKQLRRLAQRFLAE